MWKARLVRLKRMVGVGQTRRRKVIRMEDDLM